MVTNVGLFPHFSQFRDEFIAKMLQKMILTLDRFFLGLCDLNYFEGILSEMLSFRLDEIRLNFIDPRLESYTVAAVKKHCV